MKSVYTKLSLFAVAAATALLFALPSNALSIIRCDENVSLPGNAYNAGALIDSAVAATTTTNTLEMRVLSGASIQVDHGNITGAIVLHGSNDDVTYYPVPGITFTAISGSGGEIVEMHALQSRFYKLIYTHSSGTGLLKVTAYVKGKN
jgi:hypothetical protein